MGKRGLLLCLFCAASMAGDPPAVGPGGIWKVGDRYRFDYEAYIGDFDATSRKLMKHRYQLVESYEDTILEVDALGRATAVSRKYLKYVARKPGKKPVVLSGAAFDRPVVLKMGPRSWTTKRPAPKYARTVLKLAGSYSRWARLESILDSRSIRILKREIVDDLLPRGLFGPNKGGLMIDRDTPAPPDKARMWRLDLNGSIGLKPRSGGKISITPHDGKLVLDAKERRVVSLKLTAEALYMVGRGIGFGDFRLSMKHRRLSPAKK